MWIQPSYFGALVYALLAPILFNQVPSQTTESRRILKGAMVSLSWAVVFFLLFQSSERQGPSIFTWIGIQISILIYAGVMTISALTLVLYSGPILQLVMFDGPEYEYDLSSLNSYLFTPIFEELIYRSCIITGLLASGWSLFATVFVSAFIYAAVPFYNLRKASQEKGTAKAEAIKNVLVQTGYTILVGFYTGYCYMITGNLYASILVRSFTNFMERPSFAFLNPENPLCKRRKLLLVVHLLGVLSFLGLGYFMLDPKLLNSWHYQLTRKK